MVILAIAVLASSFVLAYAAIRIETLTNPGRFIVSVRGALMLCREALALGFAALVMFLIGDVAIIDHFKVAPWWAYIALVPFLAFGWAPAHHHNRRLRKERNV